MLFSNYPFTLNIDICLREKKTIYCAKYSRNCKKHWLISWALPLVECFYPLSPGHYQGSGSVVLIRHYGPVVSDQLFSSLFIHSQLDAFSAACPSLHTSLFLHPALILSLPSILHNDWAGNPLHPISTGNSQVLQPRLLHCSCSSVYLASSVHRLPHILSPRGPSAPPSPVSCHLETI